VVARRCRCRAATPTSWSTRPACITSRRTGSGTPWPSAPGCSSRGARRCSSSRWPGFYSEIARLTGDEAEIQRLAYVAILNGGKVGLQGVAEELVYFSRSFEDYEHLVATFVDDATLRAECLAQAREITVRRAADTGITFEDYRYPSVCRLSILRRGA